jgi:putative ABC transport system substrate-binding protein
MRRREFLMLLGGVTSSLSPIAARAVPAPGKWRIGMLVPGVRQKFILEGLRDLGYTEGQNLAVERRFDDKTDRLTAFSTELAAVSPDIIVAVGTQAAQAAQRATSRIPIVMLASNPVGDGLVESLAHSGGNVTGLSLQSPELSGKRLELLREASGSLSSVAVFYNPEDPPAREALKETSKQVAVFEARIASDIAPGFERIAEARPGALVILTSPLMTVQASRNAALALQMKLPSIYADPAFAKAGGLMSYGPNFDDVFRNLAVYIDKIFKGAKPADLPVEQPTRFELVVNLKTGTALGLRIPATLLATADEVIE